MSVGRFLIIVFTGLGGLSALAYWWTPRRDFGGKIPIVWVSDNNPARAAQIDAFNRENPDLFLYLDYSNSGSSKVMLQSSSGVGPDLFDYASQEQQLYVEAGILWDVTEAAEKMGFSVRQQGWSGGMDLGLCFGRQYGYYCNTGANILIYNKNVFDYFQVPYPKEQMTWEEFQDVCQKVTSPPGTRSNERIFALADATWSVYFHSQQGEMFTEEGLLNLNSPEFRSALQWHKDQLFKFRVMPSALDVRQMSSHGGWGSGSIDHLSLGRFAMMFNGDWTLIRYTENFRQQIATAQVPGSKPPNQNLFFRPLRLGSSLIPHMPGAPPCYRVGARMSGINSRSPNREHALRVLKYFAGPTYSRLINEGMDWLPGNPKYVDLGVSQKHPELARVEMHEMTKKAMGYGYVPRVSEFLLTTDLERVIKAQISRMESNPDIPVENLIAAAEKELATVIQHNLNHHYELRKIYEERVKQAEARRRLSTSTGP